MGLEGRNDQFGIENQQLLLASGRGFCVELKIFLLIRFLKLTHFFFFTPPPTSIFLALILLSNFRWHFKSFYSFWPMTCLSAAHRHSKPIPTAKHLFCVYQCHFGEKCLRTPRLPANYYYITLCGGGGGVQLPPHLADGTISTFPLRPSLSTESKACISNLPIKNSDECKIVK